MRFLAELVEAGKFKPAIDRYYTQEKINDAHAYVDTDQKLGGVVVIVEHSD